jgi:hypothetical protein
VLGSLYRSSRCSLPTARDLSQADDLPSADEGQGLQRINFQAVCYEKAVLHGVSLSIGPEFLRVAGFVDNLFDPTVGGATDAVSENTRIVVREFERDIAVCTALPAAHDRREFHPALPTLEESAALRPAVFLGLKRRVLLLKRSPPSLVSLT